jgi:hypothetical protein
MHVTHRMRSPKTLIEERIRQEYSASPRDPMRTPQRTHIEFGSRIYAQKGMVLRAIQQFEAALEIHAGEPTCLSTLGQLRGALN